MSRMNNFLSSKIIKCDESTANLNLEDDFSEQCQLVQPKCLKTEVFDINISNEYLAIPPFQIETAQKWFLLKGKNDKMHKFPVQTILPKVQMARYVPPKQLPQDVEVDRRRQEYSKIHIADLLREAELIEDKLSPTEEQYYLLSEQAFPHFLPISFYDNFDFDCHSPEAWLKLGLLNGVQYPLPAQAYVPVERSLYRYEWQYVAVYEYNETNHLWTVMVLMDENVYLVPKVQIMFLAENRYFFVDRIRTAVEERNKAEQLIKMEAIIDCVLLEDNCEDFSFPVKGTEVFQNAINCDKYFCRKLRREVYLLFEHLMACYAFEKFIRSIPKEFPGLDPNILVDSLPKAHPSHMSLSERKMIKDLQLDLRETRYSVFRSTLYYIAAGIQAMMKVAIECQYIETLNMFICQFAKPLSLNDFIQAQQQHSTTVSQYLKTFWPTKISTGICTVLRQNGKGWLDIALKNWGIYEMCKISRFILQVRYRMEASIETLLQTSIETFARYLSDPCLQFLGLKNNFVWKNDYIQTMFPYPKPIFSLLISVSTDRKVFYSTEPYEFRDNLVNIFKKSLEKASGVRCIDAETMLNLHFAPNLYIKTVELIEALYISENKVLDRCYTQAVIPLRAYARLYERFINFYLLDVKVYMKQYEAAKKTSAQVKNDILEHKRQKEELREVLPATITIGPFLVIVDPMKQYMIKKHIDIVRRLFEYYVQRMFEINELMLESCLKVYNRINERPQSIEHLYAIRDFALTVPDVVEQLKADIQIMWLEYEILDNFFYNLSDYQFNIKWQVYAWPHKILQRLLPLKEEQKLDIEEFKRVHTSECIAFEERLEGLNEEVQTFSLKFDPEKVIETAVEVKKVSKTIGELRKMGDILKYRQSLFELEELSVEFLDNIVQSFTPYQDLWYSCSDFLKLEEATIGNPIINIELPDVWKSLKEINIVLKRVHKVFSEKPEIQNVAEVFMQRIDNFKLVYNCIKSLKNENWLYLHWQELSNLTGIDFKYSVAINFLYLMRKGIMEHLALVDEISEKATNEADAIRQAWEEEERRKEEERLAVLMRKAFRKCRTDIL